MNNNSRFVDDKKLEFQEGLLHNIEEHLKILNSKIVLPTKQGVIQETRLLATVKSREKVHSNLYKFIDMAGVDQNSNAILKEKIISGLKNSYEELDCLFLRPMRTEEVFGNGNGNGDNDEDEYEDEKTGETSDDIISSISDSKIMAGEIMNKILERITMIDDPDKVNRDKLEKVEIKSIAEQYARR